jgi:hypothetical protein
VNRQAVISLMGRRRWKSINRVQRATNNGTKEV